jgi:hypothetical protein
MRNTAIKNHCHIWPYLFFNPAILRIFKNKKKRCFISQVSHRKENFPIKEQKKLVVKGLPCKNGFIEKISI